MNTAGAPASDAHTVSWHSQYSVSHSICQVVCFGFSFILFSKGPEDDPEVHRYNGSAIIIAFHLVLTL